MGTQLRDRRVQVAAGALEHKLGLMRREVVGKAEFRDLGCLRCEDS